MFPAALLAQALSLAFLCAAAPADQAAAADAAAADAAAASEALVGDSGGDQCDASDMECALSLRQLRASVLAPSDEEDLEPSVDGEEGPQAGQARPAVSLAESLQRKKKIVTGYHLTSPAICEKILVSGFKPGSHGWCGGAIYFAASHKSVWTKAIGTRSHTGCMLQAKIDMGRVKKMGPKCDMSMNPEKLSMEKADSMAFNPGDGVEYVIFDPSRVISVKKVWQDPKLSANSNNLAPIRVDAAESAEESDDAPSKVVEDAN